MAQSSVHRLADLSVAFISLVEAARAAAMQEATAPLLERIGVLEKATPGRQTLLSEDKEVKKEKGFKGLSLRI